MVTGLLQGPGVVRLRAHPNPSSLPSTAVTPKPLLYSFQPSILDPQPDTRNPRFESLNPQLEALNSQSEALNPQPSTPNPQPSTATPLSLSLIHTHTPSGQSRPCPRSGMAISQRPPQRSAPSPSSSCSSGAAPACPCPLDTYGCVLDTSK